MSRAPLLRHCQYMLILGIDEAERAALILAVKLHAETDCGSDGLHWAECEALASCFGYDSFDEWRAAVQLRHEVTR